MDPDQPPDATAAPKIPVPAWALTLGMAPAVMPILPLFFVVPRFVEVFREFGAELPWITQLWTRAPWVGLAWPLLVALDGWRPRQRDGTAGFLLRAILGSLVFVGVLVVSIYRPIFKLAESI
jgi:type II secretory pathway component PulF